MLLSRFTLLTLALVALPLFGVERVHEDIRELSITKTEVFSEDAACKPFSPTWKQVAAFFRKAHRINQCEENQNYFYFGCQVSGRLKYGGQACDFTLNAGGTARINCAHQEIRLACDRCKDELPHSGREYDVGQWQADLQFRSPTGKVALRREYDNSVLIGKQLALGERGLRYYAADEVDVKVVAPLEKQAVSPILLLEIKQKRTGAKCPIGYQLIDFSQAEYQVMDDIVPCAEIDRVDYKPDEDKFLLLSRKRNKVWVYHTGSGQIVELVPDPDP